MFREGDPTGGWSSVLITTLLGSWEKPVPRRHFNRDKSYIVVDIVINRIILQVFLTMNSTFSAREYRMQIFEICFMIFFRYLQRKNKIKMK
jgi:hypothetical protein